TIAAGDFGIDPFQDHDPPIETDHFAVVDTCWVAAWTDVRLAFDASLEGHVLHLWTVVAQHHDTASWRRFDGIRLGALTFRSRFSARAILLAMIRSEAPAADNLFRVNVRRNNRRGRWRRSGRWGKRIANAAATGE